MMILPSRIEKKFIFILPVALATPFLRPCDPQVGKPCLFWTEVFASDNNYMIVLIL